MTAQVTFFPVRNGDCTLFEFGTARILTDINYCNGAEDEDGDFYDIGKDIRDSCERSNNQRILDVFVLTHPDVDHLRGAEKLLHLAAPDKFPEETTDPDRPIRVDEIWTTLYTIDHAYEDREGVSKSLLEEIRRRHRLEGTTAAEADGNRLRVLTAEGNGAVQFPLDSRVTYQVLAPNSAEANLEQPENPDERVSCNDTSLIISWRICIDGSECRVMVAGDAGRAVWERIGQEHTDDPYLTWDILLTPHHCSRSAMFNYDGDSKEYSDISKEAREALGHKNRPAAFAVASARAFDPKGENTPPSAEAKDEYLEMLREGTSADASDRFCHPETHDGGDPSPVCFELTASGPLLKARPKNKGRAAVGAFISGSRYGTGH